MGKLLLIRKNYEREIAPLVFEHLSVLEQKIFNFPSLNTELNFWVHILINFSGNIRLEISKKEKLISMSSNRERKIKHAELQIDTF